MIAPQSRSFKNVPQAYERKSQQTRRSYTRNKCTFQMGEVPYIGWIQSMNLTKPTDEPPKTNWCTLI